MSLRTPAKNIPWLRPDNKLGDVYTELLRTIDALMQASIVDRDLSTPPGSPAQGAAYIVASSPTGAWAGRAGQIATYWGDEWTFYAPVEGWQVWLQDENVYVYYTGSAWSAIGGGAVFIGDSGSGGVAGLVPAPAAGDATKFLKGDGTWATIAGGGDALTANPLSQFAATTSAQLRGVISDETGTGVLVFANSPTLVTPNLGTPASGTLTNCTGLPIGAGVSGLAAGIATFLGTPTSANLASAVTDETGSGSLVFATSPTLVTPALGTPSSGTLTNCAGLPVSTGLSGLGAGVATFLATPSSANLASAVTGETGSGALVFGTSPTIATPVLTVNDNDLTLRDNLDTTKQLQLQLSGITTATTRTLTVPDANTTIAGTDATQTLTNKTINLSSNTLTATSAQLATAVSDETGSGSLVFATSPTLVTPLLGTPTSGTLTNCTGLPISTGVSGLAAGIATWLATPSSVNLIAAVSDETGSGSLVFATSPTLVTPLLGTPTSGTLTNCTGLPISTGVSGLAAGIATFLATPSSANLAAALTDETGTGANVFATSPTLVTPILGTPTSGTLTNCTGLPVSSGISGLGTGVATFLATPTSANLASAVTDETGTGNLVFATSPTLVTPVLGTPTSGTLTNCTGLPIGTGVSGLGAGVATFLTTPSSANLISAVTDETGSGLLVFGTSPSLTTPSLSGEVFSTAATVTAGTNSQGQGPLTNDFNVATTTANNPSGVTLPTATVGRRIFVANRGTNPINVYPATGAAIDALAANASIQIPVNGIVIFNAASTTLWYSSMHWTMTAPTLGTPLSGTLTNCTGLPVSTGISGLGTGIATWLATPSSSNLAAAVTDETGSGALVFATSPTLVTPVLGTPASGTLTNCTGLPTAGLVDDAVTNTKLANMATATFKGRTTAGTGDPEDLTATQATALLNVMVGDSGAGGTKGLVPSPAAGDASKALFGDGLWKTIPGGGDALTANPLSQFAATTSLQLRGVISDETGTGPLVFADTPTLIAPVLGTPTSGTLTNCTGLPISTGVSGLGSGIATFLATPSSANLLAALTDETGSGAAVFATSPSFTTSILPNVNDGCAIGTGALSFSDFFLASGGVINFNNGDITLTHASNTLTFDGGQFDCNGTFRFNQQSGVEGGEFRMKIPASGTTINTEVVVDINSDLFRIFEGGGSNRGFGINLANCQNSVGTRLLLIDGQYGITATTLSGTSVDFTGIPAGTRRITIVFNSASASTSNDFLVQLGDAGGIETTGYTSSSALNNVITSSTAGFNINMSNSSEALIGVMVLNRMGSGLTWVASHVGAPNTTSVVYGSGAKATSEELTQIRLTIVTSGNWDAGTAQVYWEF